MIFSTKGWSIIVTKLAQGLFGRGDEKKLGMIEKCENKEDVNFLSYIC